MLINLLKNCFSSGNYKIKEFYKNWLTEFAAEQFLFEFLTGIIN